MARAAWPLRATITTPSPPMHLQRAVGRGDGVAALAVQLHHEEAPFGLALDLLDGKPGQRAFFRRHHHLHVQPQPAQGAFQLAEFLG